MRLGSIQPKAKGELYHLIARGEIAPGKDLMSVNPVKLCAFYHMLAHLAALCAKAADVFMKRGEVHRLCVSIFVSRKGGGTKQAVQQGAGGGGFARPACRHTFVYAPVLLSVLRCAGLAVFAPVGLDHERPKGSGRGCATGCRID